MSFTEKEPNRGLREAFEAAAARDMEPLFRGEPEFSPAFEARMQDVLRRHRRGVGRVLRNISSFAAAAAVICGLCIGLPKLQERMNRVQAQGSRLTVETTADTVTFRFRGDEGTTLYLPSYHTLAAPEGYEYVQDMMELGTLYEDWQHENGTCLNFTQGPLLFSSTFWVGGCTAAETDIRQPDGTYVTGYLYRRDGFALLVWTGTDRYYRLMARGPDAGTLNLPELALCIDTESE